MNLSSRCRICLIDNVLMHSVVGSKLHEIYETLSEVPFEINDGRPLQVCYICRKRLLNCYKLQANCWKSEKLFNQILTNNNLTSTPFQEIKTLKMSEPIVHASIVPMEQTDLCSNTNIDVSDLNMNPLEMLVQVQIKEEPFEDVDDMPNTETQHFGIEVKQEKPPELEHVTVQPSEDRIDNTEVNYLDMPIKEETPSKMNHIIIEVDSVQPIRPVSEEPKSTSFQETSENSITKNLLMQLMMQRNENNEMGTQFTRKSMTEQNQVGFTTKIDEVTRTKMFECDICHKCFNARHKIRNHMNVHIDLKSYQCTFCMKFYKTKEHLKVHIRTHTGEKPYKCEFCDKPFSQTSTLNAHKRLHYVDKPHVCEICGKGYVDKLYFINHLRAHRENPYQCNICYKRVNGIKQLKAHIRKHNISESYQCEICHTYHPFKSDLASHMLIHTGEKPFKCPECDKSYKRKSHLTTHLLVHTGEKPYKCDICDKPFSRSSNLNVHKRLHIVEKP